MYIYGLYYGYTMHHVQEKATKNREADSFRNIKSKTFYTPEDGHVGRNM
jgi:hypothetical protein